MSVAATVKVILKPDESIRTSPERLRAAEKAAEFVRELTVDAFPDFAGDLELSIESRSTPNGHEFLIAHLQLFDEFGCKGFLEGIDPLEFLESIPREKKILRLWRNVLWNRFAKLEERLDQDELIEEFANAQP